VVKKGQKKKKRIREEIHDPINNNDKMVGTACRPRLDIGLPGTI
jgi:hypothetical protein